MIKLRIFAGLALFGQSLLSSTASAAECSHLWIYNLEINPTTPKPMSGDTFAAYGLAGFYDEPRLKLVFTGKYTRGRFMSFESYRTKGKKHVDAIFDVDIEPDSGSQNPYLESGTQDAPHRTYQVEAIRESDLRYSRAANTLKLASTRIHSIFFRAYVPSDGVVIKKEDLPKIFAVDAMTGKPRNCPTAINTQYDPGLITALLRFVRDKPDLEFRTNNFDNGTNSAVPKYYFSLNKTKLGDVSIVRFKAPSFFDSQSGTGSFQHSAEVRYWSLCIQNLKESETLGCIPDYLAKIDTSGFVTVAVGRGDAVRTKAANLGYSFLEDRRQPNQDVLGIFYRNLIPRPDFAAYEGDFMPSGIKCSKEDFLQSGCKLQ